MRDALRELAAALCGRLQRRGLQAHDVTIEVRYPDFRTATRTSRLATLYRPRSKLSSRQPASC